MKTTFYLICIAISIFSCKIPRYSYVPPAMNNIPYSRAGEAHLAAQFGTVGLAASGGYAITQNINVNAWVGTMPGTDSNYNSKESEFSIGFQTNPHNKECVNFYLGIANGSNEKVRTGLSGHYTRSFFQVQHAAFDQGKGDVQFDGVIGVRVNYLAYDGTKNGAEFDNDLWYYEPFFTIAVGGKNVRLQILQGLAIKNSGEWGDGVRIFPYSAQVGLLVKLRKDKK